MFFSLSSVFALPCLFSPFFFFFFLIPDIFLLAAIWAKPTIPGIGWGHYIVNVISPGFITLFSLSCKNIVFFFGYTRIDCSSPGLHYVYFYFFAIFLFISTFFFYPLYYIFFLFHRIYFIFALRSRWLRRS